MGKVTRGMILTAALLLCVGSTQALPYLTETIHHNQTVLWDGFHNYDYVSSVDIGSQSNTFGFLDGYWIGSSMSESSVSWSHTLPGDLSVPADRITRARLWIDGYSVDNRGNMVRINGMASWSLNHWDFFGIGDNTAIQLEGITDPDFWNNGSLNINILANESRLRIDKAVLAIDYVSAIPEPLTLSLFGLGLVGVIAIRKKMGA